MRILVTGGAGFVGSRLVEDLAADGARVEAFDDLSTGSLDNLEAAVARGGVDVVRGDVRDAAAVEASVARADAVFHLAGAVGVRTVAEDPTGTWSRNVEGTAAVLRACARRGTRCVIASTSEVYGPSTTGVLREDEPGRLDPAARRDVYAVSKAAGESLALALHRASLLPVTIARLFNVVGPRQSGRYGMVLPRFARAAVAGDPLTVHGDGRQTRCFLHVADAVAALRALASCGAAEGLVVNVGSDEEVSILGLARAVVVATGGRAPVRHVAFADVYGEGFVDPPRRRPCLSRLASLTGFAPRRSLADAVSDVVAYEHAALSRVARASSTD